MSTAFDAAASSQAGLPCLLDLDGRMARKQNTSSDHVAVADGLAAESLVDGERLGVPG